MEGARVRAMCRRCALGQGGRHGGSARGAMYGLLAKQYELHRDARRYDPKDWDKGDLPSRWREPGVGEKRWMESVTF